MFGWGGRGVHSSISDQGQGLHGEGRNVNQQCSPANGYDNENKEATFSACVLNKVSMSSQRWYQLLQSQVFSMVIKIILHLVKFSFHFLSTDVISKKEILQGATLNYCLTLTPGQRPLARWKSPILTTHNHSVALEQSENDSLQIQQITHRA